MQGFEKESTAAEMLGVAEHNPDNLAQLRTVVLTRILWALLPLATLATGIASVEGFHAGHFLMVSLYLFLLSLFFVAAIKRLGYTIRVAILLGAVWLYALSELWMFGVASMADVALFAFVLFAGVLFSFRAGVIALCGSLAIIAVIAVLYMRGDVPITRPPQEVSLYWLAWIHAVLMFSLLTGASLSMVTLLCQRLDQSLRKSQELIRDLRGEVDERQKTECQLRESEKRYRTLLEYSPACTKIVDRDSRLQYMSCSGVKGLGIEDITPYYGEPYPLDFYPVSFRDRMAESLKNVRETGEIATQEGALSDVEGKELWFHSTLVPVKDEEGEIDDIIIVSIDITERKQAEEVSRENASLLQLLMDNIPDSIYFKDEQLRFMRVNKGFAHHLGLTSPEEAIGKDDACFFTPEHARSTGYQERRIIETSEPLVDFLEEEHILNGRIRWVSTTQVPVFDANGKLASLVGISRDVTERRLLEEDLSNVARGISAISGESFFRQVVQYLSEALEVKYAFVGEIIRGKIDRVTTVAAISGDSFQENFVYDLVGTPCNDVSAQGACMLQADLQACYPGDQLLRDMDLTAYAGVPLRDSGGAVLGVLVVMHTAPFRNASRTESLLEILAVRAASEMERMQNESDLNRLKQAVEQAEESILITDRDAAIQYVNPAFEKTTGYTREEVLGQNPRLLKSDEHNGAFVKNLWATLLQGNTWRGQFTNRKKGGTKYIDDATISPVRDSSGKTVSYISVQRDITHERELEQQLRQAQKMESIGTLAGGIAHDFNNILQGILGFTEIARENANENPELLAQCLEEIEAGGQRAADLVGQILTFSRRSDVEFEPLTLQTVIEEALRFLRSSIPATIQIEGKIDPDCGRVVANATQIHQVVTNLCTNAMHAMDEKGGVLTVSLKPRRLNSWVETLSGSLEPGMYVELLVVDTGTGIEPHLLGHLLDPFFTTKEVGKGTGLGLAMVHGIVRSMGGGLSIESTVGEGTTIRVTLPLLLDGQGIEESNEEVTLPRTGSEHVLIVDDEESITKLSTIMLETRGFTVESYNNVGDALEAVQSNPEKYDVAILDYTMPGKTGLELAQDFQSLNPEMPVILATGLLKYSELEQTKSKNIVAIIRKPFRLDDLVALINRSI